MSKRLALLVPVLVALAGCARAQDVSRPLPAPALDSARSGAASETAVLAGGCFWGIQGVFQHVKGVREAVSGYSGGQRPQGGYEEVSTGETGNAESVRIVFDPRQISFGQILRVYFSVMDPTTLDRQGPDEGSQYRSAIFASTPDQERIAKAYIAQLSKSRAFEGRIVTEVAPLGGFYRAEDYHQDYLVRHPDQPYIAINDLPKIAALKRLYPAFYRAEPALVFPNRS
ncbi:MAG TPA: peptide-methionine (S)-S-oxide reductase MsrA [Rhizomicrobium sp.]|nr:peptide-methionine (S)-S-oxide reductase MsrA [Rhizomicrobium sp.]